MGAEPDEVVRTQANRLAVLIGAVIESQGINTNVALTALATVTASVMFPCQEEQFEGVMDRFVHAVRVNRACLQEPPKQAMN